jgi:hypothetical protein
MRPSPVVGLLALCLLAGCGAQPGKTVVKWDGTADRMTEASNGGTYALYSSSATNPDITYPLAKGDKLGFVTENGKTYAVAGSHKDAIKSGKVYYWKYQKD